MTIKETILPLADAYAIEKWADAMHERQIKGDSNKARAALFAALDAADREVERLKAESANDADAREVERLNELALTLHIVMAQRDALKAECVVQRNEASKVQHENAALKSGWEQERNVADMLKAENAALRFALQGLHDDNMDYIKRNHLGAENNHWLVAARAALAREKS